MQSVETYTLKSMQGKQTKVTIFFIDIYNENEEELEESFDLISCGKAVRKYFEKKHPQINLSLEKGILITQDFYNYIKHLRQCKTYSYDAGIIEFEIDFEEMLGEWSIDEIDVENAVHYYITTLDDKIYYTLPKDIELKIIKDFKDYLDNRRC